MRGLGLGQLIRGAAAEDAHSARQTLDGSDLELRDQGRLTRALGREHQRLQAGLLGCLGDRQRALLAGSDGAVERELAEQDVALQRLVGDLPARRQHSAG